ncbi:hypothetical protein IWZ01DRAFT_484992 [Phyllosticta capitalensis]
MSSADRTCAESYRSCNPRLIQLTSLSQKPSATPEIVRPSSSTSQFAVLFATAWPSPPRSTDARQRLVAAQPAQPSLGRRLVDLYAASPKTPVVARLRVVFARLRLAERQLGFAWALGARFLVSLWAESFRRRRFKSAPDERWLRASVDVADSEFRSNAARWHVVYGLFCLLFALTEQQRTPRLSAIAVANGPASPQGTKKSL